MGSVMTPMAMDKMLLDFDEGSSLKPSVFSLVPASSSVNPWNSFDLKQICMTFLLRNNQPAHTLRKYHLETGKSINRPKLTKRAVEMGIEFLNDHIGII
jgi:hypothetical protein